MLRFGKHSCCRTKALMKLPLRTLAANAQDASNVDRTLVETALSCATEMWPSGSFPAEHTVLLFRMNRRVVCYRIF